MTQKMVLGKIGIIQKFVNKKTHHIVGGFSMKSLTIKSNQRLLLGQLDKLGQLPSQLM